MAWWKRTDEAVRSLREELASLREEISGHLARLEEAHRRSMAAAERIDSVEAHVAQLGAELARQLHELGDDLDRLSQGGDDGAVVARLDELRVTQMRLANEQARYEIAFREDLAALAEQLRRR